MIADAYLNSPAPFTGTMAVLHEKFCQLHQLALRRITRVLESPDKKRGEISAFQKFSLHMQSLLGLLRTVEHDSELELNCGSHVACLLRKLSPEQRAEFCRHMFHQTGTTLNLVDLSNWLR